MFVSLPFLSFLLSPSPLLTHTHTRAQAPFHGASDDELGEYINAGIAAAAGAAALPEDGRDLVARLLAPQPAQRLAEYDAIKAHAFFERINFEDLYKKQLAPPPLPAAAAPTPGGAPQPDSSATPSSSAADPFAGFTFVTARVS